MMGWNGMGSGWMWLVMLAVIVGFWAVVVVLLRAVLRDRARDRDRDPVPRVLQVAHQPHKGVEDHRGPVVHL